MIFFNEYYIAGMLLSSIIYWLFVPVNFREQFLITISFGALCAIQPVFSVVLLLVIVAIYYCAKGIEASENKSLVLTIYTIALLVLFLLAGKYAKLILELIFSNETSFLKLLFIPMGISYLSFKLIAFVFDVYRGIITNPSLYRLLLLIFFMPTFPAGPVERYQTFSKDHEKKFDGDLMAEGLGRIILGYAKKVIVVNYFFNEFFHKWLSPQIVGNVSLDLSAGLVALYLVSALVYAYVDLSAYADLAVGFSRLFGYRVMENMNFPLFRANLSEYWNNWHMSLSSFCRDYVYFPVLGSTRNNNFALYASFWVMGLWHNISLNWFIWGCWHASGIIIWSKWSRFKKKKMKKLPFLLPKKIAYTLGMLLTCLYSAMGFSFIMLDSHHNMLQSTKSSIVLLLALIF